MERTCFSIRSLLIVISALLSAPAPPWLREHWEVEGCQAWIKVSKPAFDSKDFN